MSNVKFILKRKNELDRHNIIKEKKEQAATKKGTLNF